MRFFEALLGLQAIWQVQLFATVLLRTSAILTLSSLALLALRGAPSWQRHLALSAALVMLPILPLVSHPLPTLEIAVPASSIPPRWDNPVPLLGFRGRFAGALGIEGAVLSPGSTAPGPGPVSWLILAWAVGAATILARSGHGTLRLRRRLSRAKPVTGGLRRSVFDDVSRDLLRRHTVRLLEGEGFSVPFTVGLLRPAIVLPVVSAAWSEERLRLVLTHELAHVRRRDWALFVVGRLVCAVYWFHPGVWWLFRRLRLEAECACDRHAIARAGGGERYASHLLAVARGARRHGFPPDEALTFVRPGELELRVRAALARPASTRRRIVLAISVVLWLVPVSAVSLVVAPCDPPAPRRFFFDPACEWIRTKEVSPCP